MVMERKSVTAFANGDIEGVLPTIAAVVDISGADLGKESIVGIIGVKVGEWASQDAAAGVAINGGSKTKAGSDRGKCLCAEKYAVIIAIADAATEANAWVFKALGCGRDGKG